jgi:hypothetical protein
MAQVKFKVEDGLLVRGQANVAGDTVITGTLTLGDGVTAGSIQNPIKVSGDLTPNTNDNYNLGNTNNRWSLLYAVGGNFSDTLSVTEQSSLFGGAYLESDITFNINNHAIGTTTAAPIVHSTNTFIYDTLKVGPNTGSPYLLANSSTIILQSNVNVNDSSLLLKDGLTNFYTAADDNFGMSYVSASPTVIDEFLTSTDYRMVKYFVTVEVPYNNAGDVGIQTSEVVLLINGNDTSISEFNIMTNPISLSPIVSYSVARAAGLIRLTGYVTSSVTNSTQPNVNISFMRMATQ